MKISKLKLGMGFCSAIFAFASSSFAKNEKVLPLVVVSIRPLALLVQDICQSECQIQALIPLGQSEHHWEPGPREIAAAKSAVAAVGIGLNLDEVWFSRVLQNSKKTKKIEPILIGKDKNTDAMPWQAETKPDIHQDKHEHGHGNLDPHVWFDPIRMSATIPFIVKGLSAALPESAKQLELNGAQVQKKLGAVQVEIAKLREGWRDEPVVVAHDALSYWAARYQIKTISLTGVGGSGYEISAKTMAKAISDFKKSPPMAIVVEREDGATKNLAREIKTEIVVLDLAGGVDKHSYYDWLLAIAHRWDQFAKATVPGKK